MRVLHVLSTDYNKLIEHNDSYLNEFYLEEVTNYNDNNDLYVSIYISKLNESDYIGFSFTLKMLNQGYTY